MRVVEGREGGRDRRRRRDRIGEVGRLQRVRGKLFRGEDNWREAGGDEGEG